MVRSGDPRRETSLKWEDNGELAGADLRHILQRLQQVDPQASSINRCELKDGPSTSPPV